MHISEGVLSPAVLGAGAVLAAAGIVIGLRKLDYDRLMTVAILAAAFFVGSLIHVPIGPSSVHLILNGLLGMLLGWAAFPSIFVALMLQAILFQYGGITVLGVNTFNMAFPAVVCYYAFRPMLLNRTSADCRRILLRALSVAGAGLLTALSLSFSAEGFSVPHRSCFWRTSRHDRGRRDRWRFRSLPRSARKSCNFPRNSDMRMFRLWCMALCLVFAGASFTSAHRVNIFAFVDGDAVQVECGFNRKKVKQGPWRS
ncbi:MAG: cobalt transporter CbiM [Bilophila wadsworthia]